MTTQHTDTAKAADELWSELDDMQTGMLWVPGSGQHPQPMSHFVDRDTGVLWFVTSSETDLYQEIGAGRPGAFTMQSDDGDYFASLKGQLSMSQDDEKLDALWSSGVAAWFEHGREDPTVRLLRFAPTEAAIWTSKGNSIVIGMKLMKAAMTDGDTPDIGSHHVINLVKAA